jgi:hypothetical protein
LAWRLAGRILRIIATITVGPGQVLNEVLNVIFGGPGVVGAEGESLVSIGETEIDEGDQTFEFLFTGFGDNFRWHGQIQVSEGGDSNWVNQVTQHPLEQQQNGAWVASAAGLMLGCGWGAG